MESHSQIRELNREPQLVRQNIDQGLGLNEGDGGKGSGMGKGFAGLFVNWTRRGDSTSMQARITVPPKKRDNEMMILAPQNAGHSVPEHRVPWIDCRIQRRYPYAPGAQIAFVPSYAVLSYSLVNRDGDVQPRCWVLIEESREDRAASYLRWASMISDRRGQASQTATRYGPQVGKEL